MRLLHRQSVRHALSCLIALMLGMSCALHAEPVKLLPNAQFTLEFPELPATYYQQKTGKETVPQLSAQLPEDYAAGKTFPLFVFIDGGNGGAGANVAFTRSIIGPRGFIAVNLPLFKDPKAVLAGWIHYLAFDLFVGLWITQDAIKIGLNRWLLIPVQILTFMFGPVGFGMYWFIRRFKTKAIILGL